MIDMTRLARVGLATVLAAVAVTASVAPAGEARPATHRVTETHKAAGKIPPCKYEDGSGQAVCYWDAGRRGNGRGDSFTKRGAWLYFLDGHRERA